MRSKKGRPPKPYRSWFEHELSIELKGTGAKYEKLILPYYKMHTYKPDWVLPNGIILEAKGRFTAPDRAKHLHIKAQHPDLDIRFVFQCANNKIINFIKHLLLDILIGVTPKGINMLSTKYLNYG